MLTGMRNLALDYLIDKLDEGSIDNVEKWYEDIRNNEYYKLLPYLTEDTSKIERVYILEISNENSVLMSVQDLDTDKTGYSVRDKIPFVKPSGAQSPAIGPIIKRSINAKKMISPSDKIIETTIKNFENLSKSNDSWAVYFKEVINVLQKDILIIPDGSALNWRTGFSNMLSCAASMIGPEKNTVFLTIKDSGGRLPGENKLYCEYMSAYQMGGDKYKTQKALPHKNSNCYLCGREDITVFPNALRGAGINLKNLDRVGAFPGLDTGSAWKGYGICGACADLLYVYKFHILAKRGPKHDIQPFTSWIAGDKALIIPTFFPGLSTQLRQELLHDINKYINSISGDVSSDEDNLLELFKENDNILNLAILWAEIGQEIKDVSGMITNVLPSRLKVISQFNQESDKWNHAIFPKIKINTRQYFLNPDLSLRALKTIFYRPGGKKAQKANESKRLSDLKRLIVESVYKGTIFPQERFWDEVLITAGWYLFDAIEKKDGHNSLLYEGMGKNGPFLTAAGWIRHLAWWIYYFKCLGVMEMEESLFKPKMDTLKPYFGPETGINSKDKAFAFLLGVLYGKVMQIQGARHVNVGANALTWLKRLTLKGQDLPELYIKIREKLLVYDAEKSEEIKMLISEVGRLGSELGDNIKLNDIQTNYFLLLGQSLTVDILPTKEKVTT